MDLGVHINFFYHGLLSVYRNALDVMVGETFSDYDAVKTYKILNGLLIFPMIDETGVFSKLDKI